ncbi:MAG: hypothetical protein AMJ94_04245 [Deltaproteobacteria bacterium SM23_61]|nr:MAG: hypothetical protein AMJ94_04245 [Deltaproteobacteria bacterium SM23_61]
MLSVFRHKFFSNMTLLSPQEKFIIQEQRIAPLRADGELQASKSKTKSRMTASGRAASIR